MASITFSPATIKAGSGAVLISSASAFSAIDAGNVVYASDGKWRKAQANSFANAGFGAELAITIGSADSADQLVSLVKSGNVTCTGLTSGMLYYLASDIAGSIVQYNELPVGVPVVIIGIAVDTTTLNFNPFYTGVLKTMADPLTPLIKGLFGITQAAPMPTQLALEAGFLNKHSDTVGYVSTDVGKLSVANGAGGGGGDPSYYFSVTSTNPLSRVIGRCLYFRFRSISAANTFVGWGANQTMTLGGGSPFYGLRTQTSIRVADTGQTHARSDSTAATTNDYELWVMLRNPGFAVFIRGNEFSNLELIYASQIGSQANMYPGFTTANTSAYTLDNVIVADLPAPFNTEDGICIQSLTPVSNTSYTTQADGIFELSVVAPATLTTDISLRYRVVDDNNYHALVYTSTGAFRAYVVIAGVITEYSSPINVANAIAVTEAGTLQVYAKGNRLRFSVSQFGTFSMIARGDATNSNFNTATTVKAITGAGWTLGTLRAYKLTDVAWDVLPDFFT